MEVIWFASMHLAWRRWPHAYGIVWVRNRTNHHWCNCCIVCLLVEQVQRKL